MKAFSKSITKISCFVFFFTFMLGSAQQNSIENKSAITITYPISSTVWETNEPAELQWNTQNIDTSKSIRFFLVRNKTVVQELGRFKNSGGTQGIKLAKNVGSGDNYQVMGIELFPNNKEQIAKYATAFFSIRNKESDMRKKEYELAKNDATPPKVPKRNKGKKTTASPPLPQEFEGRRISYVKNLTFDSERLKVKIWDHEKEDGDIVSIYLNNDLVLSKHLLTNDLREFDIQLDPTKPNDLLLYAHNLGEVSPNTVSVEIASSNKSETITLNSYLRSCEAVLIHVKE